MTDIDETWLRSIGFKWHQFDRQPDKHWLLWIGAAMRGRFTFGSYEDLGVEIAPGRDGTWFCWLRDDSAGRYHRFIHIRHIETQEHLIGIIEGLIGYPFDPANAYAGSLRTPQMAQYVREENERLDRRMNRERPHWHDVENGDPDRGGPVLDHVHAFDQAKKETP